MQLMFEEMLLSEEVTDRVFDDACYALERRLTRPERQVLVAAGRDAYAEFRAVTTGNLFPFFPATGMVLRDLGVPIDDVLADFLASKGDRQASTPRRRPESLAEHLRDHPSCANALDDNLLVLLAWELLMVAAPPESGARHGLRLARGVWVVRQPWDMGALVSGVLDAGRWVAPVEEPTFYAVVSNSRPMPGGRAAVANVGVLLGTFLLAVDDGQVCVDDLAPLEEVLVEEALKLGLVSQG
jgi:hypothetical protein